MAGADRPCALRCRQRDTGAFGVLRALTKLGKRMPEVIGVIAFGDNEVPAPIYEPQPRLCRIGRGGFMDVAWSMSTVEANDHVWRCDCITLAQLRP